MLPGSAYRPRRYFAVVLSSSPFLITLLTPQPQNAIPDVVIWMISGNKRIGSCRIPASSLMFSETSRCRGKMCGKFQTIFLTVSNINRVYRCSNECPPPTFSLRVLKSWRTWRTRRVGLKYVSCCGWAWSSSNMSGQKKPWEGTSLSMLKR